VSAYTEGNPASKLEFQTTQNVPLPSTDRFITFSVDSAALFCQRSDPALQFFLLDQTGKEQPAYTTPINPCNSATTISPGPNRGTAWVGTFVSDKPILYT